MEEKTWGGLNDNFSTKLCCFQAGSPTGSVEMDSQIIMALTNHMQLLAGSLVKGLLQWKADPNLKQSPRFTASYCSCYALPYMPSF